jgi:hypothetical protein
MNRASAATMKPNAAGNAAWVAGTTSCSALSASPPFGKWQSSAATPKASVAPCEVWK